MAQCMRVYIITPPESLINKANESLASKQNISSANSDASSQSQLKPNIFLKPRVQPNPNAPIFWPCENPILLKSNSIWVLRLP